MEYPYPGAGHSTITPSPVREHIIFARLHASAGKQDKGFSLIELLVVIIIIGIIAAIAVPRFLNQRKLAEDAAAKADVTMIAREVATYFGDNSSVAALAVTRTTANPPRWRMAGGGLASAIDLGRVSPNVVAARQRFLSSSSWCVSVKNSKGKQAVAGYRYSAGAGLALGVCP